MTENFLFKNMTILSSDDRAFLSHRLPMSKAAKRIARHVWVICVDTGKVNEIKKLGFRVQTIPAIHKPSNIFSNLKTLFKLFALYHKINPDLIYHSSVQMSFLGSLASLLKRNVISINSITGVGHLFSSEQLKTKILKIILSPILKILWNGRRSIMLFQNPSDRDIFYHRGLSPKNAPIIPGSGVDDTIFKPSFKKNKAQRDIQPLVIGCAIRLIKEKGVEELINAIRIVNQHYEVELRIAGTIFPRNPSSYKLKDIERWSRIESVKFMGDVTDMVEFWQNCDVAILPSHREGFPKALLEAAACGLPLLGSNVPGVREIVIDNINGLLFTKGDCDDIAKKIKRMCLDKSFRKSAGKASRNLIGVNGLSNIAIEAAFIKFFKSLESRAAFANDK